jgi:hypothetical protein
MFSRRLYALVRAVHTVLQCKLVAVCVCNPTGVVTTPHCSNYCTSIPVNPILTYCNSIKSPAFAKVAPMCIYRARCHPRVLWGPTNGHHPQVTDFHKGHLPLFRLPRTTKAVELEALLPWNERLVCPCVDKKPSNSPLTHLPCWNT